MKRKKPENWMELAKACEASEMTTYGWCKSNGVPYTSCRNWIRRLREEQLNPENARQELSVWGKVEMNQPITTPLGSPPASFAPPPIKLNCGTWNIELNQSFDPVLLGQIMSMVEARC